MNTDTVRQFAIRLLLLVVFVCLSWGILYGVLFRTLPTSLIWSALISVGWGLCYIIPRTFTKVRGRRLLLHAALIGGMLAYVFAVCYNDSLNWSHGPELAFSIKLSLAWSVGPMVLCFAAALLPSPRQFRKTAMLLGAAWCFDLIAKWGLRAFVMTTGAFWVSVAEAIPFLGVASAALLGDHIVARKTIQPETEPDSVLACQNRAG